MPKWWPGRRDDEPEDDRTSAQLGRGYGTPTGPKPGTPSPRRGQFSGPIQQQIKEIVQKHPGISQYDIARIIHERRDDRPFEGKLKRTAMSNIGIQLNAMQKYNLIHNSNPGKQAGGGGKAGSRWSWGPVAPAQGGSKPSGWTGGHARKGEGKPENRRSRGRGITSPAEPDDQEDAEVAARKKREEEQVARRKAWEDEQRRKHEARWAPKQSDQPADNQGGLGIFRPATPKQPDKGGDDDNGGGLGIFKGV